MRPILRRLIDVQVLVCLTWWGIAGAIHLSSRPLTHWMLGWLFGKGEVLLTFLGMINVSIVLYIAMRMIGRSWNEIEDDWKRDNPPRKHHGVFHEH